MLFLNRKDMTMHAHHKKAALQNGAPPYPFSRFCLSGVRPLFADTCLLAGQLAQVVELCPADLTDLVDFNAVNGG